ncbi:MAG TPA: LysR substrate-binding domain-containing protein [Steroidobacteraceae bacterium]|nr:LysR substrate-binding domain-containing protein [Steroidobacteraceae bacterium]
MAQDDRRPRFDQLLAMRTFARVAQLGSFTRAADDMSLARSVVSQLVRQLESKLGGQLLNRTTRKVSLTAEGEEYLERSQRIFTELAAADELVSRARFRPQGRLRVDVPTAFGRHLLMPALPEFMRRYPDVQVEVRMNDRVVDLVREGVDLALRFGPIRQSSLAVRRIGRTRLVTCASPKYLAQASAPRRPEDLLQHRCIGYVHSDTGRTVDWSFARDGKRRRLRVPSVLAFNSPEAPVAAALSGVGIMQTNDALVASYLADGRLQLVLEEWIAEGPPISIVFAHSGRIAAKVRVFADFIADLMRSWRDRHHLPD